MSFSKHVGWCGVCTDSVSLHVNLPTCLFIYCLADDLIINPEERLIARRNSRAVLSCVYQPNPSQAIGWGVLRNGQPNVIFPINTTDMYFALDTRSLIFDPVTIFHAAEYYCSAALNQNASLDQFSSAVKLIVFRKHNIILTNNMMLYLCLQRHQIS